MRDTWRPMIWRLLCRAGTANQRRIEGEPINLAAALGADSRPAPPLIAGSTHLYFPALRCAAEAALIAGARLRGWESVHWGIGPAIPRERRPSRP